MAGLHAKHWPGVWATASVAAVVFGVTAASMAARRPALVHPLAAIGRRTLPIYVMHMPLLALLHRFCFAPLAAHHSDQAAFAMVEPAVLTVLLAAICLTVHAGLRKAGVSWLFDLPGGTAVRRRPVPPPTVKSHRRACDCAERRKAGESRAPSCSQRLSTLCA
jgi:peptidoglycan/LPS O-acetylase OafA/YrhL